MAVKTEHNGAKKGAGAWWGRKAIAKYISNRLRRQRDKLSVRLWFRDYYDVMDRDADNIIEEK